MSDIHESVFLAEGSRITGDVSIGEDSSIWFNAVLRGDNGAIRIGRCSNVQDNTVIHMAPHTDVEIGDGVSIGHSAIIHGCTIRSHTLIGMGAIIMNDAVIGENCIIGAGALVTGGSIIPDGSVVVGRPGKVIRQVTEKHLSLIRFNADHYVELAKSYQ